MLKLALLSLKKSADARGLRAMPRLPVNRLNTFKVAFIRTNSGAESKFRALKMDSRKHTATRELAVALTNVQLLGWVK